MFSYIYFIFLIGTLSYLLYRSIIMYKKGTYNPYIFIGFDNDGKLTYWKRALINFLIIFGGQIFVREDKYPIFFTIIYILLSISIIQISILNYLSYKKSKDKKIITQTLILDLILIGLIIIFWKLVKVK